MREFVRRIHFVGIGGIGMSGIAEVLIREGFIVSGSDLNPSVHVDRLARAGARTHIGHDEVYIEGVDAVVTSSAVPPDNVEVRAAQQQKIPVVQRAEMLGELMRFRRGIAIAGTHGKTTTTSLVSAVLVAAGMDPTFVIGGVVNSARTNARLGRGEYLVAEADESDASFLHLQPQIAVITNIDNDHMETYGGDFDQMRQAYLAFLHNLPFYGLAILCADDAEVRKVGAGLSRRRMTYGLKEGADVRAIGLRFSGTESRFEVVTPQGHLGEFRLRMPGGHNVQNALAAIAVASKLGIGMGHVRKAFRDFEGVDRRFQAIGTLHLPGGDVPVVDDYAHHPREIRATLQAARACWPERRVVAVFQPHRYSRTRDLLEDFVELLAEIDPLMVTEVYSAGEPPLSGADGRSLCKAIRKRGGEPILVPDFMALKRQLPELLRPGDVLLTMGAGDIGRFATTLCSEGWSEGDVS